MRGVSHSSHSDTPQESEPLRSHGDPHLHSPDMPVPPPNPDTERARVAAIRAGDVAAFEAVFLELYDDLLHFATALLNDEAAAEDIVDDAMGDLWIRRDTLDVHGTLRAYLFGAVRNRAMSVRRHNITVDRAQQLAWPLIATLSGTLPISADATVLDAELTTAVTKAIAALPPRAREALMLKHEQGLTYSEVAAVMGLSVKTVEIHIGRAFRGLREMLEEFRTES